MGHRKNSEKAIVDKMLYDSRENTLKMLKKAKEQEKEKLNDGAKYIKINANTWVLKFDY